MWLSTTLFLTQGLLLVHVSVVSCMSQWGYYSPRTSSYSSRSNQPTNPRVMTSDEAFARFGGARGGARYETGRPDDDIERQARAIKEREARTAGAYVQAPFRRGFGRTAIFPSNDLMQKIRIMNYGIPDALYPRRTEYSPSFSSTPSARVIYTSELPTANQPFSLFSPSPQSERPAPQYTPSSSSYYTPPVPSRGVPSRWGSSNRWDSFEPMDSSRNQRNAQQNPSNGQSTPRFVGSPSTRSQPLSTPSPFGSPLTPSQPFSSIPSRSSVTQSKPSQGLFGSPPTESQPLPNPPRRSPSSQSDPLLNSGAQTDSPEETYSISPANKKKYKFSPDGRRLAGRQNATWPKWGTATRTSDAGRQLGESFQGILMPQAFIDGIRQGLDEARASWKGDTEGNYKRNFYTFNPKPEAAEYCDIELVQQAIREAQGDYDTYDDPWTNESIYSDEVMALNKRLHNEYRAKHYAQPLEYMEEIHPVAHDYANFLAKEVALYGISRFQHNTEVLKKRKLSENLYAINSFFDGKTPASLVQDAIDGWYEEVNRYAYFGQANANIEEPLTGHFTCLVWRSSKRMGLGIGKYRNDQTNLTQYVVVVNYDPQGNMQGEFDVNVIRAGSYDGKEDQLPSLDAQQQKSDGGLGSLFGFSPSGPSSTPSGSLNRSPLPTANQPFSLFSPSPQSDRPATQSFSPSGLSSTPSGSLNRSPLPTANQPFSLFSPSPQSERPATQSLSPSGPSSTPLKSPNTPSSPSYTPAVPSRRAPSPTDQRNAQQNPSNGQSTPSPFGSPSTRSQPLSTPSPVGSPSTRSQPLSSTPNRSPSTKSDPLLSSGAQTNSPEQTNSVTPAGENTIQWVGKKQYTFGPDGRRLAGKQNATWPKLGTWTETSDAGKQLGESFKGILMPQDYIDEIKRGLGDLKATGDTQGVYKSQIYKFPTSDPEVAEYCDIELVEQAVREAQGDYDTYDDPWTNESIYSDEVMALNKRLHNEYRAKHYAQPLEYMEEIHPVAHDYANFLAKEIVLYGLSRFEHNTEVLKKRKWSENLYTTESEYDRKSPSVLVQSAIKGWYEEVNRYAYFGQANANTAEPLTGHFTCLVWRSTKRMGLGIAKYRNDQRNKTQYVVVVNYDPAGNMQGDFDVNVIQAGSYDGKEDQLPSVDGQQEQSDGGLGNFFGF